jgi:hypothetical protein
MAKAFSDDSSIADGILSPTPDQGMSSSTAESKALARRGLPPEEVKRFDDYTLGFVGEQQERKFPSTKQPSSGAVTIPARRPKSYPIQQ